MILVTGAGGIIGSQLCDYFYKNSIEFLPIYNTNLDKKFKNAVQLDLSSNIRNLNKYAPKIKNIIHLAAGVPHSRHHPNDKSTYLKNINMDKNISKLQKFTNANLIYASTCGLYDKSSNIYKSENENLFAHSYYFKSKLEGEKLFKNSKTSIIRIAAPIGYKIKKGLVLDKFFNNSIEDKELTIWGSGFREQDFIDCDDIINLMLKILDDPIYDTFNVASGNPITMVELANSIISFNNKGKIKYLNKIDPNDNATARYSVKKANSIYGWSTENDLLNMFKKYLVKKKLK